MKTSIITTLFCGTFLGTFKGAIAFVFYNRIPTSDLMTPASSPLCCVPFHHDYRRNGGRSEIPLDIGFSNGNHFNPDPDVEGDSPAGGITAAAASLPDIRRWSFIDDLNSLSSRWLPYYRYKRPLCCLRFWWYKFFPVKKRKQQCQ